MKHLDLNVQDLAVRTDLQIIRDTFEETEKKDGFLFYSTKVDYTFTDIDKIKILFITTGTRETTVTLPDVAINKNRIIEVCKIDSGAGALIVDGKGVQKIYDPVNLNGNTQLKFRNQWQRCEIKSDGSQWILLNSARAAGSITVSSADYIVQDYDMVKIIYVTTGAANRTITLPTAADNMNRVIKIIKTDDGAGKVIVDGEGGELVDVSTTWDIGYISNGAVSGGLSQYMSLQLRSNGAQWYKLSYGENIIERRDTAIFTQGAPVKTTWYNPTNRQITIPAGTWDVEYEITVQASYNTSTYVYLYSTLAKVNNNEDDKDFTAVSLMYDSHANADMRAASTFYRKKRLVLAVSDIYYLNIMTDGAGNALFVFDRADLASTFIRAYRVY